MAGLTGEITAVLGNSSYRLVLGLRGIAELQRDYGNNLQGIMGDRPAGADAGDEAKEAVLPDFDAFMQVVKVSLRRFHPEYAEDLDVVEGLLAQDWSLPGRLIAAAFPDAQPGGARGKKKARG